MKTSTSKIQAVRHSAKQKQKMAEKAESRTDYTYSDLDSCKPGSEKVHFYAVILDA